MAFFLGCSDHAHKHGSLHVHQPLRGGVLYELGKHGSGHNFELVTNEKGQLELFVLDAHAENYVRISQKQIDLQIIDSNNSITVLPYMPLPILPPEKPWATPLCFVAPQRLLIFPSLPL